MSPEHKYCSHLFRKRGQAPQRLRLIKKGSTGLPAAAYITAAATTGKRRKGDIFGIVP